MKSRLLKFSITLTPDPLDKMETNNFESTTVNHKPRGELFGTQSTSILNNFFSTEPRKLQLSVPSQLLCRIILQKIPPFFKINAILKL